MFLLGSMLRQGRDAVVSACWLLKALGPLHGGQDVSCLWADGRQRSVCGLELALLTYCCSGQVWRRGHAGAQNSDSQLTAGCEKLCSRQIMSTVDPAVGEELGHRFCVVCVGRYDAGMQIVLPPLGGDSCCASYSVCCGAFTRCAGPDFMLGRDAVGVSERFYRRSALQPLRQLRIGRNYARFGILR